RVTEAGIGTALMMQHDFTGLQVAQVEADIERTIEGGNQTKGFVVFFNARQGKIDRLQPGVTQLQKNAVLVEIIAICTVPACQQLAIGQAGGEWKSLFHRQEVGLTLTQQAAQQVSLSRNAEH